MAIPQDCRSIDPHTPLPALCVDADLLRFLVVRGDGDLCSIAREEIVDGSK